MRKKTLAEALARERFLGASEKLAHSVSVISAQIATQNVHDAEPKTSEEYVLRLLKESETKNEWLQKENETLNETIHFITNDSVATMNYDVARQRTTLVISKSVREEDSYKLDKITKLFKMR